MFNVLPDAPDLAIGWSLGGQLLVKAIALGHTRPKKLVLLGAPFQCISDDQFAHGISPTDFQSVRNNYRRNPEAMLAEFQVLIAAADKNQKQIAKVLSRTITRWPNGLFWLDTLGKTTCHNLDFSAFPETLIIHGQNDRVIHPASAEEFSRHLPAAKLFLLPDSGHALHLCNTDYLIQLIEKHNAHLR
jgi:pimeloyl-ACP methyl ester carboxylesterase